MSPSDSQSFFDHNPQIFFRCVEDSNDTVMLTDTEGRIQYVNKAWQSVYGYSWKESLGETPALIRSDHQDATFYKQMWRDILDPKKGYWRGELINRSKNGKDVPAFLTITPFRNDSSKIVGYMGIAVDITEKRRMEAQILHQDRLASLGVIAAGLAHEIGNPLGVIRGRAEYLSLLMSNDESAKSNLEIVVKQIDRISKLIYSLLHLAKSSPSDTLRPVEVAPIVEEVLGLLHQKTEDGYLQLENRIGKEVIIYAEPARLEQVILNIGLNAIHAIETAIAAGRTEGHRLTVTATEQPHAWELVISDTGCGISEENLPKIFAPFFSTKDCGVGTGLGLPICEHIVRDWNGTLTVTSQEGIGTTFRILLPKPQ